MAILNDIQKVWKDSFEIEMIGVLKDNNLFATIAKVRNIFVEIFFFLFFMLHPSLVYKYLQLGYGGEYCGLANRISRMDSAPTFLCI